MLAPLDKLAVVNHLLEDVVRDKVVLLAVLLSRAHGPGGVGNGARIHAAAEIRAGSLHLGPVEG